MFLPQLITGPRLALACGLVLAGTATARAQTAGHSLRLETTRHYHAASRTNAMLAALSAEAGIPFFATPALAQRAEARGETSTPVDPALCLRAGVGLSAAVMSGSQVNVEHGILGCRTETAGLPITVSSDPAMAPPPTSRTGEYSVDLMLRYRLLHRQRLQVEASLIDQALAYSIDSPISGNNLLAAMSVQF